MAEQTDWNHEPELATRRRQGARVGVAARRSLLAAFVVAGAVTLGLGSPAGASTPHPCGGTCRPIPVRPAPRGPEWGQLARPLPAPCGKAACQVKGRHVTHPLPAPCGHGLCA